jgi:dephospho-CoA kinase
MSGIPGTDPKNLPHDFTRESDAPAQHLSSMARLVKIGLTGGIATGKSTVLRRWEQAGAGVIDSDQLAHQMLEPGATPYQEVVRVFGEEILNPDRTVNRRKLGDIVFADEQKRQALNRIVHPAVRAQWQSELVEIQRRGQPATVVVAIPLLYEVGAEKECDQVVAVGCSETNQIARLQAKGLSATQAQARIRAQWPLSLKMDRADFVIWNDGALELLEQQADIVWETIKESRHAS